MLPRLAFSAAQRGARDEGEAEHVHLELAAHHLGRRLLERRERAAAGVVHDDVEPAAFLHGHLHGRGHLRLVRDVGEQPVDPRVPRPRRGERVLAPREPEDRGPRLLQPDRRRLADPRVGPRDEDDLAFECLRHVPCSFVRAPSAPGSKAKVRPSTDAPVAGSAEEDFCDQVTNRAPSADGPLGQDGDVRARRRSGQLLGGGKAAAHLVGRGEPADRGARRGPSKDTPAPLDAADGGHRRRAAATTRRVFACFARSRKRRPRGEERVTTARSRSRRRSRSVSSASCRTCPR